MTKHEFCKKQIGRLQVFESTFPKTSAGIQELIETLERSSRNDDHAKRTVDRMLKDAQFCPTPAQIITAASSEPAATVPEIPPGCARCYGSGWMQITRRINGLVYDGVKFCECGRGQWLKQHQAAREGASGMKITPRSGELKRWNLVPWEENL